VPVVQKPALHRGKLGGGETREGEAPAEPPGSHQRLSRSFALPHPPQGAILKQPVGLVLPARGATSPHHASRRPGRPRSPTSMGHMGRMGPMGPMEKMPAPPPPISISSSPRSKQPARDRPQTVPPHPPRPSDHASRVTLPITPTPGRSCGLGPARFDSSQRPAYHRVFGAHPGC